MARVDRFMDERRIGHALEVVNDWLMIIDGTTVVLSNGRVPSSLGVSHSEALGRDVSQVLPEGLWSRVSGLLSEMEGKQGNLVQQEVSVKDPALGDVNYLVRGDHRDGLTYLALSRVQEVEVPPSDRLLELEDRLSAFLSLTARAGIGFLVFEASRDEGFRIRSVNEHALRIAGRTEDEVINIDAMELVHPDDRERAANALQSLLETGSGEPIDLRILDSNGEPSDIRLATSLLTAPEGTVGLAFVQDLTQVREALELQNKMVQAIDRVRETVVLADAKGRIFYANQAALRNSGYTFEEVVGKPVTIFHSPEGAGVMTITVMREFMRRGWWRGDMMACTKEGKRYPAEVSGSMVLDEAGQNSMTVVVSRKIEERQRFEAQLMMARNAMERLRDLMGDDLCPSVERDLSAMSELLSGEGAPDTTEMRAIVDRMKGTVAHAVLALENLPAPESVEELRPISVSEAILERLPNAVKKLKARGQDIDIRVGRTDPDLEVMANEMLPDLILGILSIIQDLNPGPRLHMTLDIDPVPCPEGTDGDTEEDHGSDTICYAKVSFSSRALRVPMELRGLLSRREMPVNGTLSVHLMFAIETARLLLFLYHGHIVIEDLDHHEGSGQRISVVLPIAGMEPPGQMGEEPIDPYLVLRR